MAGTRARTGGRRPAIVFYVVNVLLLPITLIGYVIWLARIYMVRRASGGFAVATVATEPVRSPRS